MAAPWPSVLILVFVGSEVALSTLPHPQFLSSLGHGRELQVTLGPWLGHLRVLRAVY